jgi:sucrose porin
VNTKPGGAIRFHWDEQPSESWREKSHSLCVINIIQPIKSIRLLQSMTDFFERPKIRFFATWMRWDHALDNYCATDTFGSAGYHSAGTLFFGAQLETWF